MVNLDKILEYQKKDAEIVKVERLINSNENKKIFTQMISVVKDAQNKSASLENDAGSIVRNFEKIKKVYEDNLRTSNAITSKELNNLSIDDLKQIEDLSKTIVTNLTILENKLISDAEKVRTILAEFENTKKKYNLAREKYNFHKAKFEEESVDLQKDIDQKSKALLALEKDLDANILAKYKQKRAERIYPVLVPCIDKTCGGCRMELPSAILAVLKRDGVFECEHCRRIIYSNE